MIVPYILQPVVLFESVFDQSAYCFPCAFFLCDPLLLVVSSVVLPAVQKLTLKCLLLLFFLIGARAIWIATLWVSRRCRQLSMAV